MDFKTLYDALARKAKSRNDNFTFMEGNPRKFGHGAPDPDWALMTIREGVKQGIVSQQQANDMSKHFSPHARFEHTASGEVKVRAHTRDGKPVAAHTRSAPDRTPTATPPFDGRTPPVAPQHYPPLDTPAQFPDPLESSHPSKKYPHVEPHSQRPMPTARRTRTLLPPFEDTPLQPAPRRRPYGVSLLHMTDTAPAGDSTGNNMNGTQVAQNTGRYNPVGDIIENSRNTPAQVGVQIGRQGTEIYREGKRLLTEDLKALEHEERQILEKYPTNSRAAIRTNIGLVEEYDKFIYRNNVPISREDYLKLQRIQSARRKRQIYGTP